MSITLDDAADTVLSHPGSPPTPALLDAIRDSATAGDETGDLVPCHDLMLDEGLFHILVPRELGGAGGTATDWFDAGLAVARADPSAGWIMTQGAVQSAWIAVSADPSFCVDFFAARRTIATSSAGQATAERDGDDYLVRNARWAYVSGSQGASYLGGMVRTTRPDGGARDPHGARPRRRGHDRAELGHPRPARHRQPPRRPRRLVDRARHADVPMAGPRPSPGRARWPPRPATPSGWSRCRPPR